MMKCIVLLFNCLFGFAAKGITACDISTNSADYRQELAHCVENITLNIYNRVELNESLVFQNMTSVKIIGYNDSVLKCWMNGITGLRFYGIKEVHLSGLHIKGCGSVGHCSMVDKAALSFEDSNFVTMNHVVISHSKGRACSIHSATNVTILHSRMEDNQQGLHVRSTFTPHLNVMLENNTFKENSSLSIDANEIDTIIKIKYCNFTKNNGSYGGGLFISLSEAQKVYISIEWTNFTENKAIYVGGGAYITFSYYRVRSCPNITFVVMNTEFNNNTAIYGGGIQISSRFFTKTVINITFDSCKWKYNKALFGSAARLHNFLNLSSNPLAIFNRCCFHSNKKDRSDTPDTIHGGSLSSIQYKIIFSDQVHFIQNTGSALFLELCLLVIEKDTKTKFCQNNGTLGGALLLEDSEMEVYSNSSLDFINNTASGYGGAMYIAKYRAKSETCFFKEPGINTNYTLTFSGNKVSEDSCSIFGSSIFIKSIGGCSNNTAFESDSFFKFEDGTNQECKISTGLSLKLKNDTEFEFVPGKSRKLQLQVVNYYNRPTESLIMVTIELNSRINISAQFILPNDEVILYGAPNTRGSLSLALQHFPESQVLSFEVNMVHCPPGYIFNDLEEKCQCSPDNYVGLQECDDNHFVAILFRVYWIGYQKSFCNSTQGNEDNLFTAVCPRGYCHDVNSIIHHNGLPQNNDIENLEKFMCSPKRTGFLCGGCKNGHSVYFHSDIGKCQPDKLCSVGWAFFLLSEIFPITLIFLLVIFLNIQLTSGSIQGFILYAQMVSSILNTAVYPIKLKDTTSNVLHFLESVYRMFDLEFFAHDKFSYCLWQGASSLNIIAVKYITIFYSIVLVAAIIIFLGKCYRKINRRNSTVHGISSFLVMWYSQCAKVSIYLLTPVYVYGKNRSYSKVAVYYDGRLDYFKGVHLAYALPVIILAFPIIFLPPMLLLIHPLFYKLLGLVHIEESKFTKFLCKIFPLERFKPFFDSFQSCFKDNCRFFAGLYFLYRLVPVLTFAIAKTLSTFYFILQIQLLFMLFIHIWCHPYIKKWHNKQDTFIFATLALINLFILFNLNCILQQGEPKQDIYSTIFVPIVLGCLPLLVVIIQCTWRKKKQVKMFLFKAFLPFKVHMCEEEESTGMLLSLEECRNMSFSGVYQKK